MHQKLLNSISIGKSILASVVLFASLTPAIAQKSAAKPESSKKNQTIYDEANKALKEKNYLKLIELLEPIAENNSGSVKYYLGLAYHISAPNDQYLVNARKWYEAALKKGEGKLVAANLGLIYLEGGPGVSRDAKRAESILLLNSNDIYAKYNLAKLYSLTPEFFSEENLRKALSLAQSAQAEGLLKAKDLASTITCALNNEKPRNKTWINAQGLEAYELSGNVKKLNYSDNLDFGSALFGKSGNLILFTTGYTSNNKEAFMYSYSYDSDCQLMAESRRNLLSGETIVSKKHMYRDGRLDFTQLDSGTAQYIYTPQSNGSVFSKENINVKYRNGAIVENTNYRHFEKSGRLIWSSTLDYPAFGSVKKFSMGLVKSGGYTAVSNDTVTQDFNGQASYKGGFYYTYDSNGNLSSVIDRAGRNRGVRGHLVFEYDLNGNLKRVIYRDKSNDMGIEKNDFEEYVYTDYKIDNKNNWIQRVERYQFEGVPIESTQNREISYWN